jgi:hypothetical protein
VPDGFFRLQELANRAMLRKLANSKIFGATFLTVFSLTLAGLRISGGVMP